MPYDLDCARLPYARWHGGEYYNPLTKRQEQARKIPTSLVVVLYIASCIAYIGLENELTYYAPAELIALLKEQLDIMGGG